LVYSNKLYYIIQQQLFPFKSQTKKQPDLRPDLFIVNKIFLYITILMDLDFAIILDVFVDFLKE
jgi:hypothetical protein